MAHLEKILGPAVQLTRGRDLAGDRQATFEVATFADQPVEGAVTLVTVGLSDTALKGPEGEILRQELLLCAWNGAKSESLYTGLFSAAQVYLDLGASANPGSILELEKPLGGPAGPREVFLYEPTYHPEELATVPPSQAEPEPIEIVWLIPVTPAEAALVDAEGPDAFESYLAANDPDLLDLGRSAAN